MYNGVTIPLSLLMLQSSGYASFISPTVESDSLRAQRCPVLHAGLGFGASNKSKSPKKKKTKKVKKQPSQNTPYVKSDTDSQIAALTESASNGILGQAVSPSNTDEFWSMAPVLIQSKFPHVTDLDRIAGFIRYATNPCIENLEEDIINDKWRPHNEIHAFMPGLGDRRPFLDPEQLELCRLLEENYDVILSEYEALVDDMQANNKDRFQSVTSMNYEAGWKTVVLFYNGHRIPGFPYHLCPVTLKILETVPIGGRIAGFNRQQPQTGIPLHSDGNNMWLTCQMG